MHFLHGTRGVALPGDGVIVGSTRKACGAELERRLRFRRAASVAVVKPVRCSNVAHAKVAACSGKLNFNLCHVG